MYWVFSKLKRRIWDNTKKISLSLFNRSFILAAPAAPPSSLSANDIGTHSVNISWKRPKYFQVDFYTVQLSSALRNDTWTNFSQVNGNMESTVLQGLMPDTQYFIRMESTNTYGTGERKSNTLKIRTKIPQGKLDFYAPR